MVRHIGKTLQAKYLEVIPEVAPNVAPEVVNRTVALNLFDIDPCVEAESPLHVDLDLDQLEDGEE